MKRGFSIMAACLVAVCLTSMVKAEEEHRREGGGYAKTWTGTFVKTDAGKLALKHGNNNESHLVVAGEKATDEVKAKLADAEKELIGQGTFEVGGVIKKENNVVTIYVNTITKKEVAGGAGERKEQK